MRLVFHIYSLGVMLSTSELEFYNLSLFGVSYQYRFGESRNFLNLGINIDLSSNYDELYFGSPIISFTHYF